jgi:hypothetical protein
MRRTHQPSRTPAVAKPGSAAARQTALIPSLYSRALIAPVAHADSLVGRSNQAIQVARSQPRQHRRSPVDAVFDFSSKLAMIATLDCMGTVLAGSRRPFAFPPSYSSSVLSSSLPRHSSLGLLKLLFLLSPGLHLFFFPSVSRSEHLNIFTILGFLILSLRERASFSTLPCYPKFTTKMRWGVVWSLALNLQLLQAYAVRMRVLHPHESID